MHSKNHYDVLGVGIHATAAEIKKAYRRLALLNHPDTAGTASSATVRFLEIAEAHRVLTNPYERRIYDQSRLTRSNYEPEPPATPERLLDICKDLNKSLRTMSKQMVLAERLEAFILLILNEEHVEILQKSGDVALKDALVAEILTATNHLDAERIGEISQRLRMLCPENPELIRSISQAHAKHVAAMRRRKWTPIAAIAVTIVLCAFIYWYGRA